MKSRVVDLSSFQKEARQTYLGSICGSEERFRDRYAILKILGRGGFGITFLARDMVLPGNPPCVIKQLCPKVDDPASLARARQRFEQEAKTLSHLGSHAQIPQLLDYFEVEGEFYLVQEFIRGHTLSHEVKRQGVFSEMAVKRFLLEFLPILSYIHKNRVIHRDIKPGNIIRCRDDQRLVLIDFGAVKEYIAQVEHSSGFRPSTTQFVGTVGFAPPEQLASRPIYASDIYAVGITCLYLLSGTSPLDFDYEFTTGEIRWRDRIPVSDHFASVLHRMVKVSTKERYQTADEVLRALALEPHLESLTHCMNVNPKPFLQAVPDDGDLDSHNYLPPVLRQAASIRTWRAKLKARQIQRQARQRRPRLSGFSSSREPS